MSNIRLATGKDTQAIDQICQKLYWQKNKLSDHNYQRTLEKNGFFEFPRTLEQIQKRIKESLLVLVSENNNKILGFIIITKNNSENLDKITWKNQKAKKCFQLYSSATIHLIAVGPDYQQRGIGWQLLATAQEILTKMEINCLFSTVIEKPIKNISSINFHLKNNFSVVGKRKEIKDGKLNLRTVFFKKLESELT